MKSSIFHFQLLLLVAMWCRLLRFRLWKRLDKIERQNGKMLELTHEVLEEQRQLKARFYQMNDCFNILSSEDLLGIGQSGDSWQAPVERLISERRDETKKCQDEFVSGERRDGFTDDSESQAGSRPDFGGEARQPKHAWLPLVVVHRGKLRRVCDRFMDEIFVRCGLGLMTLAMWAGDEDIPVGEAVHLGPLCELRKL